MFGKKTEKAKSDVPNTVIGQGITIEAALLTGDESVRIDGTFFGNIDLNAKLILGPTGRIEGKIRAQEMQVSGEIEGNVECGESLRIGSTAKVNGDIKTPRASVDEGGQLNGRYMVGEAPSPSTTQPLLSEAARPATGTGGSFEKSFLDKSLELVDGPEARR